MRGRIVEHQRGELGDVANVYESDAALPRGQEEASFGGDVLAVRDAEVLREEPRTQERMAHLAEREMLLDGVMRNELVGRSARARQEDDVLHAALHGDVDERQKRRLHHRDGRRSNEEDRIASVERTVEGVVRLVVEHRRIDVVSVHGADALDREVRSTQRMATRGDGPDDLTADVAHRAGHQDARRTIRL